MVIEINKDIERYKESVVMGFTAKQLIYSVASVVAGGSIVLLLYPYIGLTPSVYVAVPMVAPIALGGFYSYNGMSFYEVMERKIRMMFANHPLMYVSTEREAVIKECQQAEAAKYVTDRKKKRKKAPRTKGTQEEFEDMKKKTKKMLIGVAATMVLAVIGMIVYKVRQ